MKAFILFVLVMFGVLSAYLYALSRKQQRHVKRWSMKLLVPAGIVLLVACVLMFLVLNTSIKVI